MKINYVLLFSSLLIVISVFAGQDIRSKTVQSEPIYYLNQNQSDRIDNYIESNIRSLHSFPHLAKAYRLIDTKHFSEAKQALKEYLVIDPLDIKARMAFVILLYQQKQYSEVIQQSNLALKQQNVLAIIVYRGLAKYAFSSREDALSDFNIIINDKKAHIEDQQFALDMSVFILLEQKSFQKALNLLDKFPKNYREYDYFMRYAMANEGIDNLHWAKRNYQQALSKARLNPDSVKAYDALGAIYEKQNMPVKALNAYQSALKLNPKDIEIMRSVARQFNTTNQFEKAIDMLNKILSQRFDVNDQEFLANVQFANQDYLAAAQSYQKFLAKQPEHKDNYRVYMLLGYCYNKANQVSKAIEAFQSASEINDSGPSLRYLASALESKGDINRAITIYTRLVRKNPEVETYIKLSNLHFQVGDKDNALKSIDSAFLLGLSDSQKKKVYIAQGELFYQDKQYKNAKYAFDKALALDSFDPFIEMRLAMLAGLGRNKDASLSKLEKINSQLLTPEQNAERLDYLAQRYADKGLFTRAIDAQQRALEIKETPARHFFLGSYYQSVKQSDNALSHLSVAANQQPGNNTYSKALAAASTQHNNRKQSNERLQSLVEKDPENLNSHMQEETIQPAISSTKSFNKLAQSDRGHHHGPISNTSAVIQRNNRRPDDQFTFDLFDRPLTIGGEFETFLEYRDNVSLGRDDNDYEASIDSSLSIEFLYKISDSISFFADGTVFYSKEYGENEGQDADFERGQTWLLFEEIFDTNFDLKIGPQYLSDERTWWWDSVLDGISIEYFGDDWESEIGITQALIPLATQSDGIDPNDKNLTRLLARLSLEYTEDHWLEFFYTMQHDHSDTEHERDIINIDDEDDTDADIHWLGLSANGTWETGRDGELDYWLDLGYMYGEETTINTSDADDISRLVVDEVDTSRVRGWAFDVGLKWHTEWLLNSTITLGYAIGSGELDEDGSLQYAYQQTGIQGNSDFFGDVNYLSYYGELLDPQLSNLKIFTLGLSIPLYTQTNLDIVYHKYDQYKSSDFLQGVDLNTDPEGTNKDIGQGIDIILGIRESINWETKLVGSVFRAGKAFEEDSGKITSGLSFQFNFNF